MEPDVRIELLINAIEDQKDNMQYAILVSLPINDDKYYYAVLGTDILPSQEVIEEMRWNIKDDLSNMVFISNIEVMKPNEAIRVLEQYL